MDRRHNHHHHRHRRFEDDYLTANSFADRYGDDYADYLQSFSITQHGGMLTSEETGSSTQIVVPRDSFGDNNLNTTSNREANFEKAKKDPGIHAMLGLTAASIVGYNLYAAYSEHTDPFSGFNYESNRFGDGSSLLDYKPYSDNLHDMLNNRANDGVRTFPDFEDTPEVQNVNNEFPEFDQGAQDPVPPPGGRGARGGLGERATNAAEEEAEVTGDGEFYDIPLEDDEAILSVTEEGGLVGEEIGIAGGEGLMAGEAATLGGIAEEVVGVAGMLAANLVATQFLNTNEDGSSNFDNMNTSVSEATKDLASSEPVSSAAGAVTSGMNAAANAVAPVTNAASSVGSSILDFLFGSSP